MHPCCFLKEGPPNLASRNSHAELSYTACQQLSAFALAIAGFHKGLQWPLVKLGVFQRGFEAASHVREQTASGIAPCFVT